MEIKKDEELCKLYGKLIVENIGRSMNPSYEDGLPIHFNFDNLHIVKSLIDDYMKKRGYKKNWKIQEESNNIDEIARLISCDIQYELTESNIHDEICSSNTVRNYIIEKYLERIGGKNHELRKSKKG